MRKYFHPICTLLIAVVFASLILLTGCSSQARKINDANTEIAQAMAKNYSQKIEVCSFEAVDGQSIEIKAKKFSCNVEAKPIAYVQQTPSDLEKAGNLLLGLGQLAAPIIGQAINTKATFKGLTDLTSVMATGFGHNSQIISNTSGSYNSDRHDSTQAITGSQFDSSVGDNRNNQPVTTTTDNHTVTPAPVVVTPVVTGP